MSTVITKLFLHPLFRLLFWSFVTIWLIVLGVFYNSWIRWINFIVAIISLGTVIENAVKTVSYYRHNKD